MPVPAADRGRGIRQPAGKAAVPVRADDALAPGHGAFSGARRAGGHRPPDVRPSAPVPARAGARRAPSCRPGSARRGLPSGRIVGRGPRARTGAEARPRAPSLRRSWASPAARAASIRPLARSRVAALLPVLAPGPQRGDPLRRAARPAPVRTREGHLRGRHPRGPAGPGAPKAPGSPSPCWPRTAGRPQGPWPSHSPAERTHGMLRDRRYRCRQRQVRSWPRNGRGPESAAARRLRLPGVGCQPTPLPGCGTRRRPANPSAAMPASIRPTADGSGTTAGGGMRSASYTKMPSPAAAPPKPGPKVA